MASKFIPSTDPIARAMRGWPIEPNVKPACRVILNLNKPFVSQFDHAGASSARSGVVGFYNGTHDGVTKEGVKIPVSAQVGAEIRNNCADFSSTGDYIKYDDANNRLYIRNAASSYSQQTFMVIATARSYGEAGFGRVFETDNFSGATACYLRTGGSPYLRFAHASVSYDFSFNPIIGKTYIYGLKTNGSSGTFFVAEPGVGVIEEKAYTVSSTNGAETPIIGNSQALNRTWDGLIHLVVNDHAAWSEAKLNAFCKEPYGSIYKPANDTPFLIGTAAAGGGPSATGSLTATSATIAGTGTVENTATGSLTASVATVSGTGQAVGTPTATGALTASAATVAGAGTVEHEATGSLTASNATVAGSGTVENEGTGALTASTATVAGLGNATGAATGTGTLAASAAAIAGAGTADSTGTGSLAASTAVVSGAGLVDKRATGSLAASTATIDGTGTAVAATVSGTGDLRAGAAGISGTNVIQAGGYFMRRRRTTKAYDEWVRSKRLPRQIDRDQELELEEEFAVETGEQPFEPPVLIDLPVYTGTFYLDLPQRLPQAVVDLDAARTYRMALEMARMAHLRHEDEELLIILASA